LLKYFVHIIAHTNEIDTITNSVSATLNISIIFISLPPGSKKTLIERRVINTTIVHHIEIFHRGALGDFNIISHRGIASTKKIMTIRIKGYSKNHPERPIEYIISKGIEPIK